VDYIAYGQVRPNEAVGQSMQNGQNERQYCGQNRGPSQKNTVMLPNEFKERWPPLWHGLHQADNRLILPDANARTYEKDQPQVEREEAN
jgi:hypothetical protein